MSKALAILGLVIAAAPLIPAPLYILLPDGGRQEIELPLDHMPQIAIDDSAPLIHFEPTQTLCWVDPVMDGGVVFEAHCATGIVCAATDGGAICRRSKP